MSNRPLEPRATLALSDLGQDKPGTLLAAYYRVPGLCWPEHVPGVLRDYQLVERAAQDAISLPPWAWNELGYIRTSISEHSFDFLDAQFECEAAPGIGEYFAPPYLAWHDRYEASKVAEVHEYLRSVMEEDGPYDGLIGFSQGAALAAAFLLNHEWKSTPQQSLADYPVKVAIFFNAVLLFSPSTDVGNDYGEQAKNKAREYAAFCGTDSVSSPEASLLEGDIRGKIFSFDPETSRARIQIPTLHVIGKQDQFATYSENLVKLCNLQRAQKIVVDCDHDLPRDPGVVGELAELLELVVSMGSMLS